MHSDRGDIVLEPFSGSGTTIIACEQLERVRYAMEKSPEYCDLSVKRWEQFTGQKAERITSHATQNDCHTISDLYQMQSLPLEIKVRMTQRRIRDWVEYWGEDGVYVSFSGGKDSTVLLDICRRMYPNIVAVYSDTGLEFPEIREFVKAKDNVVWVRPELTFRKVIEKCGYPCISKEQAEWIHRIRLGQKNTRDIQKYFYGIRTNGQPPVSRFRSGGNSC